MRSRSAGNAESTDQSPEHTRARLPQLYEISKLLTRFASVVETVPEVLALVTATLPFRSAVLILGDGETPRTTAFDLEGAGVDRLRAAMAHARSVFAYLVGSAAYAASSSGGTAAADHQSFIVLPLVTADRPIFGALQLEREAPLSEVDLWFVNAVTNQLAVAIARHLSIEAKQRAAETRRRDAEGTRDRARSDGAASEKKRVSAEMLRERYEALVDNIDRAFVWEADARTLQLSYVSGRAETLLGYPRERWLSRPSFWASCGHPEDRKIVLETFRRVWVEKSDQRCEHRCLTIDGDVRWFHTGLHLAYPDSSRPQLQGVSVDITAAKEAEASVRAAEKVQRLLAELSTWLASSLDYRETLKAVLTFSVPLISDICVIDEIDAAGTLRRFEAKFADPGKQLALADDARSFGPRPGVSSLQARVLASSAPLFFSDLTAADLEELARGDDHARFLRAVGVRSLIVLPLSVAGRTLGVLTLALAESNRRYTPSDLEFSQEVAYRAALAIDNARLYQEAQRAMQARQDLLAVVSHDLKNPLGAILLGAGLLISGEPDDRRRQHAETVKRAGDRMLRLINDLLDGASLDSGVFRVETSEQPVREIVDEAIEAQSALAAERSIRLQSELPSVAFAVLCDRERIGQVFANLIGNAIKFTPAGGDAIIVRAEAHETEARFSVADSGPGIPGEQMPHLFDRFWQARATARLGTGLGLSIAKGIIEAHGGRIWAESRVGVGSKFSFALPLVLPLAPGPPDASVAPAAPERVEKRPIEPKVVLVVDDDVDAREAVSAVLRTKGYDVAIASNGVAALEYLREFAAPFVVLLDLHMPVMDGWAFLAERNRDAALRSLPVIVVSGDEASETAAAAANAFHLSKPLSVDVLLATIDQVVPLHVASSLPPPLV